MIGTSRPKASRIQATSAVWQALGIDRLRPLLSKAERGQPRAWLAALLEFDTGPRRNVLRFSILLVTLLLGFWGFQQSVKPPADPLSARIVWNNLFHTLQLFKIGRASCRESVSILVV